ncbi:12331_t:CDS:1, partial [Gigaspora margarita]
KEVDEPMVFYAQKSKWQQPQRKNNYRRKQVYNAETIEENNDDTGYQEYQEYQEYLKAKQAYLASIQEHRKLRKKETSNLEAIPEDSEEET